MSLISILLHFQILEWVTCAIWTDLNGDSWPDLIVAGEWMPVRIFENKKGNLVERTDMPGLGQSIGWWTNIFPVDIDNDGDIDYMLGNAGTNTQFKASIEKPNQFYAGDFNRDGLTDPVLNYYVQGKSHPLASRVELLDQVSSLKKKFIKYEDYADATINDIADEEQLKKVKNLDDMFCSHAGCKILRESNLKFVNSLKWHNFQYPGFCL